MITANPIMKFLGKNNLLFKTKTLMDVIRQVKLPEFIPTKKKTQKVTTKNPTAELVKDISNCRKMIDIARSCITMTEIVPHDLFNLNPLSEGDDAYKSDKHILTKELEKLVLEKPIFVKSAKLHNALVIDFMSLLHRLPIGKMNIFKDLLQAAWKYLQKVFARFRGLTSFLTAIQTKQKKRENGSVDPMLSPWSMLALLRIQKFQFNWNDFGHLLKIRNFCKRSAGTS